MEIQGGCKSFLSLCFLVLAAVAERDVISTDGYNQCKSCFRARKPLIVESEQKMEKIQRCDAVLAAKEEQIQKLQEKLNAMQLKVSIHNNLENMHNEKIKYKAELYAASSEKSCSENNKRLIESLSAQIHENTETLRVLITQMTNSKSTRHLQNRETERLMQEESMHCVPFKSFCNTSTSIQSIDVVGIGSVSVLCDFETAGPGWTVVQRRFNGTVDFFRDWSEYRSGFGDLEGEFFMGLEKLHRMTNSVQCELYIKLVDFHNVVRYAHYDNFRIGSEEEHYMLKSLGTYSGSAGDALSYNLNDSFTTYDRDNDAWSNGNCANYYHSGWWYNFYGNSNLNGKYLDREKHDEKSIWWYNWKGYKSLKSVQIMIRPI
ncbi:angiopoietin-related protein 7 [Drosophila grimshawi]|uniref:angiopoietin-related protein 7 n=1 Tax=Drosophila grimshawi TaxID=7222 RepID=UPI001C93235D|nr:angiopoietin-related protein 7 [Drosophila grimshawi]